jgi:hypothetical protein
MFLTADGSVLLNEIAPRPHNSGHYTIEACNTDQVRTREGRDGTGGGGDDLCSAVCVCVFLCMR